MVVFFSLVVGGNPIVPLLKKLNFFFGKRLIRWPSNYHVSLGRGELGSHLVPMFLWKRRIRWPPNSLQCLGPKKNLNFFFRGKLGGRLILLTPK
jgi:hypothetical protein